ncbi:MAG TPA: hypothetical protein ENK12_06785 [Gammaproteobacteria bacterium]|nr:hypothetical protein [Gammaproteobacteria bacterium]
MSGRRTLVSIIESPAHPNLSALYRRLDLDEVKPRSVRDAIKGLKKNPPDYVVADFLYGYGNNYAGVNLCNLDVFLASLQKYAPHARVLVLVSRDEEPYARQLAELFPVHAILVYPVTEAQIEAALR